MATNKKKISLYLTEDLKLQVELLAKAEKRSLNNFIEALLEKVVKESNKPSEKL